MSHLIWKVQPPPPPGELKRWRLPPLLARLLYNRAVRPDEVEAFLEADSRLCADPGLLPDIRQAVSRVYQALLRGEKIAIYGDYDTDGITATAVLVEGLEALGARIIPYIPNRLEGHGLNPPALESLFQQGASLVITADCGTNCYQEVAEAQKRGQDIIITDHHSCPELLPPAVAIVNPKRPDANYPYQHLAGVGVAYKFLQALLEKQGKEEVMQNVFDLIALGTVTDISPLNGENRYFIKEGLKLLNRPRRPGIQELLRVAGLSPGRIDVRDIAWILGPRLNAAGRLEHAYLSYHLLLTPSPEEGWRLALELERKNAERQKLLEEALEKARDMALQQIDNKLLFIVGEDFPPGIAGLVAGRLVDEFRRPTIVVRTRGDTARGSARSIPEFDIIAAFREYGHLFTQFGGHPLAAGFTMPLYNLNQLKNCLVEKANRELEGLDLRPQLIIDADIPLSQIDGEVIRFCRRLAPYGPGNPTPTFLSRKTKLVNAQTVGNGEHLRLKLKDERGVVWDGIGFGLGCHHKELTPCLDIVYNLTVDTWADQERLELNILDVRPAA